MGALLPFDSGMRVETKHFNVKQGPSTNYPGGPGGIWILELVSHGTLGCNGSDS